MGEFAQTVQTYIHHQMADSHPNTNWKTEYSIDGTPVDIAGINTDHLYIIELEWRRADPADNAAKLFRHLDAGEIHSGRIMLFHIFTEYYDLSQGGISSKRKNAEFVGRMAAKTVSNLTYTPIEFGIDPPKRGQDWPSDWKQSASDVVHSLSEHIESSTQSG